MSFSPKILSILPIKLDTKYLEIHRDFEFVNLKCLIILPFVHSINISEAMSKS